MKTIYVVTHGEYENRPDPSLTQEGKRKMEELKEYLREISFAYVASGIGNRHKQSYSIIVGERKPDLESECIGVPEILRPNNKQELLFPDGSTMTVQEYAKTKYIKLLKEIKSFFDDIFNKEGENALIIGGRIVLMAIAPEVKPSSGTLYIFNKQGLIESHEIP